VYSKVDVVTNSVNLSLNGSENYQVILNGEQYFTSSNSITLPLTVGENHIKVFTDKDCQGVYEENIYVDVDAIIYPNPFTDILKIKLGGKQTSTVRISIVNGSGLVVYKEIHQNLNGTLELNLQSLESGIYFLKVGNKTYKIIKK
jgi:hypothetical protein